MQLTGQLTTMPADVDRAPAPVAAHPSGNIGRPGAAPPAAQLAPSDEALVQRLRQGEVAAGEVLARRYYEPLMRYLQRLAGSQAAEELHQQTWLSVLDHLDRFDPETAGGGF